MTVLPSLRYSWLWKLCAVTAAAVALGTAGTAATQVIRTNEKKIDPNALYMQPVPGLTHSQLQKFKAGEKQFKAPWVVFPLLGGDWGLGPTFLASSCIGCHVQAGRGRTMDAPGTVVFQQLLRLSVPGEGEHGAPRPHPNYGDQIQVFGINVGLKENLKPGEADLYIDWLPETVTLSDGEKVELRKPKIRLEKLNFGPIDETVMTSLRNTQVVFGMGYLEAVSEEDILALAKMQQSQGLNGRPNYVRDDIKRLRHGALCLRRCQGCIIDVNRYHRPQQGTCATQRHTVHHLPALIRLTNALKRCMPSVTCWHDKVAPEMLRMSSPKRNCPGPLRPANCCRHAAWRISAPCDSRYANTSRAVTAPAVVKPAT